MSETNLQTQYPDEMLHLTLLNGQVRVLLCRTTALSRAFADIHHPSPTCLAAVSRLMTATLMLSDVMKEENSSVTVTVSGDGPVGRITCVGRHGSVKAAAEVPSADLPLKPDGHLNVGGLIGHTGQLTVVKDMGLKEPYIGQIPLVSGEVGEDFAHYYAISEQQPSVVAVGALVKDGFCLSAGGGLIQPLPGCPDEVLDQLEVRSVFMSAISREVADVPLDELYPLWFEGLSPELIGRDRLEWACDCSRDKMERALVAVGRDEIQSMLEHEGRAELHCHFCRRTECFERADLERILRENA